MQGSLLAPPLLPRSSDNSGMVLLHCHGSSGCWAPQEVAFASRVFIPTAASGSPPPVSKEGRREGGSSSGINPTEMKRQWDAGDQGTNRHWHLLWLPWRGEGVWGRSEGREEANL